jgi:DNA-directed RNA polymerase sigma subunit (sigma70/sigma32)
MLFFFIQTQFSSLICKKFLEFVQDLLKLEAIQAELAEYNGAQPTFPQWAAAAGTDESTLRKRLDHGIRCKNRMVTSNVRLVISIAREFEGPGLELYDLIQVYGCNLQLLWLIRVVTAMLYLALLFYF